MLLGMTNLKIGDQMRYVTLSLTLLVACGNPNAGYVDPRTQEYVTSFIRAYRGSRDLIRLLPPINLTLGETTHLPSPLGPDYTVLGYCALMQLPTVVLDEVRFEDMHEPMKEQLVWHELGHCLLKRPHLEGDNPDMFGIPTSMMRSYMIDEATYSAFRDYYVAELFSIQNN